MKSNTLVWVLLACTGCWIINFIISPIGMFKEVMIIYSTLAMALLVEIKHLLEKIVENTEFPKVYVEPVTKENKP